MGSQSSMGGSDTGGNSDEEAEDMELSTDRKKHLHLGARAKLMRSASRLVKLLRLRKKEPSAEETVHVRRTKHFHFH